ncbi:hypothetical protein NDU88_001413 [Pleurodeles waltl]|uniref:Uncharacterized protein n=1 Tax=Pleurodeles waltl TaxID=8319 RepID=A0AAV7NIZ3_PLEWA|nr:hypothetical protein NDU88_001413 [Pleurodeles waltl]
MLLGRGRVWAAPLLREELTSAPESGRAAERRTSRSGPRDSLFPGGPPELADEDWGAWGLTLGPRTAGLRRGTRRLVTSAP